MTKTKWCHYSDLPANQCAHCRGIKPEPLEEGGGIPWRAKFPGTCKRCGAGFEEDEWIRTHPSGYAHADMGDCA